MSQLLALGICGGAVRRHCLRPAVGARGMTVVLPAGAFGAKFRVSLVQRTAVVALLLLLGWLGGGSIGGRLGLKGVNDRDAVALVRRRGAADRYSGHGIVRLHAIDLQAPGENGGRKDGAVMNHLSLSSDRS